MSRNRQEKSEHIQVKVMNNMLTVRGRFDRSRMEKAAVALDHDLRNRIDQGSGEISGQALLSMVLLMALERGYEADRLKEEARGVQGELARWRQWALGRLERKPLQKGSGKE